MKDKKDKKDKNKDLLNIMEQHHDTDLRGNYKIKNAAPGTEANDYVTLSQLKYDITNLENTIHNMQVVIDNLRMIVYYHHPQ